MAQTTDRPLRIAFSPLGSLLWTGGGHYLKNLLIALHSLGPNRRPEIALLMLHQERSRFANLDAYADIFLSLPRYSSGFWKRQLVRIQKRFQIYESPLATCLRANRINCVFSKGQYWEPKFDVPVLSWIPDFQHLHLPEMFSSEEIEKRNRVYAQVASAASRIILSSQDALQDFAGFVPGEVQKARVLPFVAAVPAGIYDSNPAWICHHYHLPERFVYLPNQFWKHKNHAVVIEAMEILKNKHPEVTIVCTGNTNEPRDPLHFARLLATISAHGLRDKFIVLGMVSYDHLFQLMRQSVAVLQPSLFEGWSTTVEEVKSVGKRIIMSDIAVHREQDPPKAVFFDPHDPISLADHIARVFENTPSGPDEELESQAKKLLPCRIVRFGEAFLNIVQEVA